MSPASPPSLHAFFRADAAPSAEGVAVEVPAGRGRAGRRALTYAELDAWAERLRAAIQPHVGPDRIVVLLFGRTEPALYAAQLAVLRSGAAYACIDPAFPDRFVEEVCADANPPLVLSEAAGSARLAQLRLGDARLIDVHAVDREAVAPGPSTAPVRPEDLAYVIYTSGTTGKPKGVMIEHRSIANLVASDLDEFGLRAEDRVALVSSPAYDSSVEETWLAFAAGATLVVIDEEVLRSGPDLASWLRAERISVFCPPPTLLRMASPGGEPPDLPDLRLLYVGGEALTADVVSTWGVGRRIVNGYGPTECTVTVVRGDVRPGEEVMIGRAVRGSEALLLDERGEALDGEGPGELCIRGLALARGYLGRPELTAQKFVQHAALGRIYRTGDLVSRREDGALVYLGRIDAQVKLRGYRIELEAIEALLVRAPGVADAACTVQRAHGRDVLAAHIVATRSGEAPEFGELAARLARELPEYMVPRLFGRLDAIPRSVGGKIDRRALPVLDGGASFVAAVDEAGFSEAERIVAAAVRGALGLPDGAVAAEHDFFLDLGGDSLSAVALVCELRKRADGGHVNARDVYEARTVRELARRLEAPKPTVVLQEASLDAGARRSPRPDMVLATGVQALVLAARLVLTGAFSYLLIFRAAPVFLRELELLGALVLLPLAWALGSLLLAPLALVALLCAKWTLIGRYRPGRTPVWSLPYLRHWIVMQVASLVPWRSMAGTPLIAVALRLLGAKVGERLHVHRGVNLMRGGWDLLELGDDVTLAQDSALMLSELEEGHLSFGPVVIEDDATIDVRASVGAGCVVERGGFLSALSWLAPGSRLRAGERWAGLPAVPAGSAPQPLSTGLSVAGRELSAFAFGAALVGSRTLLAAFAWLPVALTVRLAAGVLGVDAQRVAAWLAAPEWTGSGLLALALALVVAAPLSLAGRALIVRALGEVRCGVLRRWSLAYLRVWSKTGQVEAAGNWLSGTLFWPVWLRLAGMRIGARCEISSIIDVVPERVEIGATSFFADGIYLGGPAVHRGLVTIGETRLGAETFLGNHVVVPTGAALPDRAFYGVCTVVDAERHAGGGAWFGHPPLELPRREVVVADRRLTHEPELLRVVTRVFWEAARFTLPVLPTLIGLAWITTIGSLEGRVGVAGSAFLVAPRASLAAGVALCAAVLALKWGLLGRVKPGQHPLWTCWCSRWDFVYVAWQFWARALLARLEGTLFLTAYLRAMGMHIGERVVLGEGFAQVVDPDMLHFEDDSTVNALFQAHSFEDRVLKLDHVRIGRGASLAPGSLVFYGADIESGVRVAPHAVVMKHERLLAGRRYVGSPCEPA